MLVSKKRMLGGRHNLGRGNLKTLIVAAALAVLGVLLSVSIVQGQEGEDVAPADVEAAFGDLTRAEVEAMGYAVEEECISAETVGAPAALGAMGYHAINESLVDTTLDPLEPEVILFDADDNLIAVEYLTPPQDPPLSVLGQQLVYVPPVDHDGLHLWFLDNPSGQFADFNPNTSCPEVITIAATGTGGDLNAGGNAVSALAMALAIAGAAVAFGGIALRRVTAR